jgi:hypothetical protein
LDHLATPSIHGDTNFENNSIVLLCECTFCNSQVKHIISQCEASIVRMGKHNRGYVTCDTI